MRDNQGDQVQRKLPALAGARVRARWRRKPAVLRRCDRVVRLVIVDAGASPIRRHDAGGSTLASEARNTYGVHSEYRITP
jgi:hypothetical protein